MSDYLDAARRRLATLRAAPHDTNTQCVKSVISVKRVEDENCIHCAALLADENLVYCAAHRDAILRRFPDLAEVMARVSAHLAAQRRAP